MTLEEKLRQTIRNIPDFPEPGIQFKDITPLLSDTKLCAQTAKALADPFRSTGVDVVAGVESRGFLFGVLIAHELDCPFTMVRKSGKLPYKTVAQSYDLEYGSASIEMHIDAVEEGQRVLIHDDLLATGGTAQATAELIKKVGGKIAGFNFVVALTALNGMERLQPYSDNIVSIVKY
jgi:adenine phosphoribosyltransferase